MELSVFRVPSPIDEVFYIPEFVSKREEEYLQRKITDTSNVKWKSLSGRRWRAYPDKCVDSSELKSLVISPDIIQRLRETGIFTSSKHGEPNHVIVNEYTPGQGIMPHEDGPSYHPIVATLSLGSHTVFHYYRYLREQPEELHDSLEASEMLQASASSAIDPNSVISLLLEPRSLVITAKALYTHHLHAIEPLEWDVLAPGQSHHIASEDEQYPKGAIRVANWQMVKGEDESSAAREGGVLKRETRISLTCRDVERVVGGKGLGKVFTIRS